MARHADAGSDHDDDSDEGNSLEAGLSRSAAKLDGADGADEDDRDETDDVDEESDDDRDEGADDDAGDDEDDADDDDEDDASDDDDEDDDADDSDEDDDESDDDEEEEEEEEEDSDDDDGLDPEVEAAAARHQLPTNFEDIVRQLPKDVRAKARAAFSKRLKEVESGLGRAFQEARQERGELARIKAERKHDEEHRVDFIADLIDANPKLLEELNEELEKRETGAYRDAKKMTREQAKAKVQEAADAEIKKTEARHARGQQVMTLARKLAKDSGVPFKLVDRAIYAAVMSSETKDVTDEQIRQIVKAEARDWRHLTGEKKTERKAAVIRKKTEDLKKAKKRVTARDRGHAPAPGRRREPKELRDALTRAAGKILPDAPA